MNQPLEQTADDLMSKSREEQKQWLQALIAVHGALAAFHALLAIFGDCQKVAHFLLSLLHTAVATATASQLPDDDEPGTPPHTGGGRGGG